MLFLSCSPQCEDIHQVTGSMTCCTDPTTTSYVASHVYCKIFSFIQTFLHFILGVVSFNHFALFLPSFFITVIVHPQTFLSSLLPSFPCFLLCFHIFLFNLLFLLFFPSLSVRNKRLRILTSSFFPLCVSPATFPPSCLPFVTLILQSFIKSFFHQSFCSHLYFLSLFLLFSPLSCFVCLLSS